MTMPIFDTGRVPSALRCRRGLFLSAYWPQGEHFVTWKPTFSSFAIRALMFTNETIFPHKANEFRIIIQVLGDRMLVTGDCTPKFSGEAPQGMFRLVESMFDALEAPLRTRFGKQIIEFEAEKTLHPDFVRMMTPDRRSIEGGVREIDIVVKASPLIFPNLSNHQLLGLSDHTEIEFYRYPHAG